MTKLFIATPAYDGKVNVQYAISLAETRTLLEKNGIQTHIRINATGSLLCAERNRLVEMFIASDCTHLLLIDADLGWPAYKVLEILRRNLDVMGGCYPSRKENVFFFQAETNAEGHLVHDVETQLFKMKCVPAGFILMKRKVIETLREHFKHLYYCPKVSYEMTGEGQVMSKGYALFNTEVIDGQFWGEDFVFCRRLAECGYEIWTDPFIEFDHDGRVASFIQSLKFVEDPNSADANTNSSPGPA